VPAGGTWLAGGEGEAVATVGLKRAAESCSVRLLDVRVEMPRLPTRIAEVALSTRVRVAMLDLGLFSLGRVYSTQLHRHWRLETPELQQLGDDGRGVAACVALLEHPLTAWSSVAAGCS
jgi:hypothetical protein